MAPLLGPESTNFTPPPAPKNDEMVGWPATTVNDLKSKYFAQASDEIGVTATNDFIHGPLHGALRRQLHDGLAAASAPAGLVLDDLPDHPIVRNFLLTNPGQDRGGYPRRAASGLAESAGD